MTFSITTTTTTPHQIQFAMDQAYKPELRRISQGIGIEGIKKGH